MHPSLLIQELIEVIFQHVDDRAVLSRLARVCQAFKEPALDALYADILSLSDLLRCLPRDLWYFASQPDQPDRILMFAREMTIEEWHTLLSFSRRVKTIVVDARDSDGESFTMDTCVYNALFDCPLDSLFPKLYTLHVHGYTMYNANYRYLMAWNLLLSSNLRAIHITHMTADAFLSTTLLITRFSPLVESFSCMYYNMPRMPQDTELGLLSRTLRRWKHLRSIDCGPVNADILSNLAHLPAPSLGHLRMPIMTAEPWLLKRYHIRALDHLDLIVDGFDTFSRALGALYFDKDSVHFSTSSPASPGPRLRAVSVAFTPSASQRVEKPPSRRPSSISTSLAECVSHAHLTSIKLSDSGWPDSVPAQGHFDKTALSPLCVFSVLTELMIDFQKHPIAFGDIGDSSEASERDGDFDEALATLVSYWPRLERLQLTKLIRPVSLAGMFAVLNACPRLTYLDIAVRVDSSEVDVVAGSISESVAFKSGNSTVRPLPCNPSITWLDLTHTTERLDDVPPLAIVLHRVVPSLRSCGRGDSFVSIDSDESGEAARSWLLEWDRRGSREGTTSKEWSMNFWMVVFAEIVRLMEA